MKTFIYGLTFALAVFLGLYYNLVVVKQIAVNYDYTKRVLLQMDSTTGRHDDAIVPVLLPYSVSAKPNY